MNTKWTVHFGLRHTNQGVGMNSGKMKLVMQSATAATVISVLVSVVGAGTKWMN